MCGLRGCLRLAVLHSTPLCPPRPPGHHSQRAAANGFCVFNNVAIAARHAMQTHGVRRCVCLGLRGYGCPGGTRPYPIARGVALPLLIHLLLPVPRVLIVDWDIHHGQGTQYIFEDDPRYTCMSGLNLLCGSVFGDV